MKIKFFLPGLFLILLGSGCVQNPLRPSAASLNTTSQALSTASDGRTILIPSNYDRMPEVCQAAFNTESADTSVLYSSKERGVSLQVPFNKSWGNKQYAIPPYYEIPEDGASLQFGNVKVGLSEGHCGLGRTFEMYSMPPQTADSVTKSLKTNNAVKNTVRKQINGLTVITYQTANSLCSQKGMGDSTLVIIGKKYNYGFDLRCESSTQAIEDIAQSVKLID